MFPVKHHSLLFFFLSLSGFRQSFPLELASKQEENEMYKNRCHRHHTHRPLALLRLNELSCKRLVQLVFLVSLCFYNFVTDFICFARTRSALLSLVSAQETDGRFAHLFEMREDRDKDVRCKHPPLSRHLSGLESTLLTFLLVLISSRH